MKFDNTVFLHLLGLCFLGYGICQAWSGEVSERCGFTTFKENPIQFSISCGFQLMIGLVLIFANPDMNADKVQILLIMIGLTGTCAVVAAMLASVFQSIRDVRSAALTATEVEKRSMRMGPSAVKVFVLCILWVVLAGFLPFLYINLGAPHVDEQYIKSLCGLFLYAMVWMCMGVALCMPYGASIDSGSLVLRSIFGRREIPLHQIEFIERGFFTVSFTTREKKYHVITFLEENSSSKQKSNAFVRKLSAVSGAPHRVLPDLG